MEIEVDITKEDIFLFNLYHSKHSPELKKKAKISMTILAGDMLVLLYMFFFRMPEAAALVILVSGFLFIFLIHGILPVRRTNW